MWHMMSGTIKDTHAGRDLRCIRLPLERRTITGSVPPECLRVTGEWSNDPPHAGIKFVVPGAPTDVDCHGRGPVKKSIDLFWMAPENDGEPPVTELQD